MIYVCICVLGFDNLIVLQKLFVRAWSLSGAYRGTQEMEFWGTEL